ncbi:DUF6680 family protein [Caballeronia sp. dw_276]|uniref:DUF6680 family protein n=1 Tax=Caballeronia sp. dw_276 TaxID=2719795 RepID=UPI001BD67BB1|nr:DUF6680 family protein [Caballeronia sp. dw_276]
MTGFSDAAIVFATFAGPIAAVQVQKFLDRRGEREHRRVQVYRALMATRVNINSPQYVDALNSVPLEFHKVEPVMTAYSDFIGHLNTRDDSPNNTWAQTRQNRFITLLQVMGKALRYDFREAELTDHAYFPTWQLNLQTDQEILRKGLVDLMKGEKSIPMQVTGFPGDPTIAESHKAIQALLLKVLTGDVVLKVNVQAPDGTSAKPAGDQ